MTGAACGNHPDVDDPPPYCGDELHGADGGPCPGCGWVSHPIPTEPAAGPWIPPWERQAPRPHARNRPSDPLRASTSDQNASPDHPGTPKPAHT